MTVSRYKYVSYYTHTHYMACIGYIILHRMCAQERTRPYKPEQDENNRIGGKFSMLTDQFTHAISVYACIWVCVRHIPKYLYTHICHTEYDKQSWRELCAVCFKMHYKHKSSSCLSLFFCYNIHIRITTTTKQQLNNKHICEC